MKMEAPTDQFMLSALSMRDDGPETLHYVDPPYVFSTRTDANADYAHEMSDGQHFELIDFLHTLKGRVVLSGYPSDEYDQRLQGWH